MKDYRYKLLLVCPRLHFPHPWNLREITRLMGKRVFSYPLALPTVAALTPPHYDIRIVHEEVEEIPFDEHFDVVGVTTMVPTIARAYEIVDAFRGKGATVVMGGTYATFNPEEVLEHASCVVIGEAEGAWQKLLRAMAEAGCTSLLIGFESVNPSSLSETRKFHIRIQRYEEAIARVHAAGIHLVGSFIVGFDADTPDSFEHIYEFTKRNHISHVMVSTLTVLPGTDLRKRMRQQRRLVDADPRLINGVYPCMHYRTFPQEELFCRYFELQERLYAYECVEPKALAVLGTGAFAQPVRCPVPLRDKLHVSLTVLRTFMFTADAARRRLFTRLFPLALRGRVSFDRLLLFLLFMEAFHRYPKNMRSMHAEALGLIRSTDRGPWRGDEKHS